MTIFQRELLKLVVKMVLAYAATAIFLIVLITLLTGRSYSREIYRDQGGTVADYERAVGALRMSGERVQIRGACESACTLHLTLPRDQVCAYPGATFMFHTASDKQFGIPSYIGTQRIMAMYPQHVQAAVERRGGMWQNTVRIRATELVPPCR